MWLQPQREIALDGKWASAAIQWLLEQLEEQERVALTSAEQDRITANELVRRAALGEPS